MVGRIRVLHVVNNMNYGGMERIVAEIVRRSDPSRFDSHVLALGYMGHFGEGLDAFGTLHVADKSAPLSLIYPRKLARQIQRIAPNVIHLHSGVWYKAGSAASLANVPFQIYTDHGRPNPDSLANRLIDRRASRLTDVVACVSEPLREYVATFVRYPSRTCVVHNGVDTHRHAPRMDDLEFRAELSIPPGAPIVGSVGRLEPVKGYEVLVRAFAVLLATWTGPQLPALVVVGDGTQRQALQSLTSRLGIADAVHLVGWRSDIERITRAFTIFSMASHSEGTSVSLLEAMSSGLCPVVTDVGGNSAVLGAELAHRMVAASGQDALAAALAHALLNSAARERDARVARARVVDHFGLDMMVRRYEELYDSARMPARARH